MCTTNVSPTALAGSPVASISIPELSIATWPWGSDTTRKMAAGSAAIARCTSIRSVMPHPRIVRTTSRVELGQPFENTEGAESGEVGECFGFGDPATSAHGVEVSDAGSFLPDAATFVDELIDAVEAQPIRLRRVARGRRQLIERDLARDVLRSEAVERVAATLVPAIRAQPLGPLPRRHGARRVGIVERH